MKKPQALIGLLAALGTAIGVLVAVIGLPYGRADYDAFAELYHGPTNTAGNWHFAVDAIPGTAPTDPNNNVLLGTLTTTAGVSVSNSGPATRELVAWEFRLVHTDPSRLVAQPTGACPAPSRNCNPDFDDTTLPSAGWDCSALPPSADFDSNPLNGDMSFIGCFNLGATENIPNDSSNWMLATVDYDIPLTATAGVVPLDLGESAVYTTSFEEVGSCPILTVEMPCFDGSITLVEPPTPTITNTPEPNTATNTSTPVPPTATFTSSPTPTNTPSDPQLIKIPEQCSVGSGGDASDGNADCSNPLLPLANLWLCETGGCSGQGEGNLIVFEYANAVQDSPEAGIQGLGAYEFSVEYDNFVIKSVNPCDVVFGTASADPNNPGGADGNLDGAGSGRGPVDEELTAAANPYCDNNVDGSIDGSCTMSVVLENVVHFACATNGTSPAGPLGNMDIAALNLIPHEDLRNDIFPGNNNGVVTILKDNGCELVDTLGHPVPGSINGGLTTVCGDLAVTVRILEGDLDLDCDVDLTDAQEIAGHYGAFFGSLLYSKWLDLEPQYHDLDIDIKDIQKVFGRDGSNCQNPIPAQPPVPFN